MTDAIQWMNTLRRFERYVCKVYYHGDSRHFEKDIGMQTALARTKESGELKLRHQQPSHDLSSQRPAPSNVRTQPQHTQKWNKAKVADVQVESNELHLTESDQEDESNTEAIYVCPSSNRLGEPGHGLQKAFSMPLRTHSPIRLPELDPVVFGASRYLHNQNADNKEMPYAGATFDNPRSPRWDLSPQRSAQTVPSRRLK